MVIRMNDYVEERMPGPAAAGRTDSQTLSPAAIYRQEGHAVVGSEGILREERVELPTHTRNHYDKLGQDDTSALLSEAGVDERSDLEFYRLTDEHTYYVEFAEELTVPDDHVGLLQPQANLLRAGVMSHASPVGPDQTHAEALVHVKANNVLIGDDASIAELVVVRTSDASGGDT